MAIPQDNKAQRFPVSVKGVVYHNNNIVLLKNERDEWELPGGKLEMGETPAACVVREIEEELGLTVAIGPLLDAWVYHIFAGIDVIVQNTRLLGSFVLKKFLHFRCQMDIKHLFTHG
jgi:mutator protein MutT